MPWQVITLHATRGAVHQDFEHVVSPGPFRPYLENFYASRGWTVDSIDSGPFQPDPPPDPPILVIPGPPHK